MRILPAIDILDGSAVRLLHGNYNHLKNYSLHPRIWAQTFLDLNFDFLHVVDLDGAKEKFPKNKNTINSIIDLKCNIQVGGGIRTLEHAKDYLYKGVKRVIISSQALSDLSFTETLVDEFGSDRIIVSLDVKDDKVAINGWLETSTKNLYESISSLHKITHFIITDISRDGTCSGVNIPFYEHLCKTYPNKHFITAGGVSSLEDIIKLEAIGIKEVVVGKAIYEDPDFLQKLAQYYNNQKFGQLENLVDWQKTGGMLPAIIQSYENDSVLMMGYMSRDALQKTIQTGNVVFYSRTKKRLWMKGEESGHYLKLRNLALDCDHDTLLVTAVPMGPTCHRSTLSCFNQQKDSLSFLNQLEKVIDQRMLSHDETSYVKRLTQKGATRLAQKVGEEGVEVALASLQQSDQNLIEESADLLFHLMVNLRFHGLGLNDVVQLLNIRHENGRTQKAS